MNEKIREIEKQQMRETLPEFNIGDTVRVDVRIREGAKERTQVFEGTVLARRGGGVHETFTVRRVASGIGVERVFPTNSPNVQNVKVTRRGKARRAKLFYLRKRTGKAAKTKARDIR
ncbi:50S ribosomal protein L19 [bacterium]|nr:50S ribosomal protein L19 [bacterium]